MTLSTGFSEIEAKIQEKARKVKGLFLDVDGILTSGEICYDASGEEIKCFSVKDGLGIKLLQKAGIEIAIISSRKSKVVTLRAKELGIKWIFQGKLNKVKTFEYLCEFLKIKPEEVCYMGDDLVDLPLIKMAGFSVTVPEAAEEVKIYADYITSSPGGKGAVREITEIILKSKKLWQDLINSFF